MLIMGGNMGRINVPEFGLLLGVVERFNLLLIVLLIVRLLTGTGVG